MDLIGYLYETDFTVHEVCFLFCFFYCRFEMENSRSITVQDYFTHIKGVQLRHPHLPCLDVGLENRKVPIYIPPEVRKNLISN
jgi:hypothetical protein